jgi:tight adherence protein B
MIENRENVEELLSDFAARTGQEDIINFVDVYKACRMTGGDMERVIANSTEVMMDKMQIEKEIRTLTAQKKFEGRIISAMPLVVVLFLNIFSPDYLAVMYETVGGRVVMSIALFGIVFAYRMMMKLTEIEV